MTKHPKTSIPWSNDAVANVILWLENDRIHRAAIDSRMRVWYGADGAHSVFEVRERLRAFADQIRQYAVAAYDKCVTPDGFELGDVDWLEVAAHWVED